MLSKLCERLIQVLPSEITKKISESLTALSEDRPLPNALLCAPMSTYPQEDIASPNVFYMYLPSQVNLTESWKNLRSIMEPYFGRPVTVLEAAQIAYTLMLFHTQFEKEVSLQNSNDCKVDLIFMRQFIQLEIYHFKLASGSIDISEMENFWTTGAMIYIPSHLRLEIGRRLCGLLRPLLKTSEAATRLFCRILPTVVDLQLFYEIEIPVTTPMDELMMWVRSCIPKTNFIPPTPHYKCIWNTIQYLDANFQALLKDQPFLNPKSLETWRELLISYKEYRPQTELTSTTEPPKNPSSIDGVEVNYRTGAIRILWEKEGLVSEDDWKKITEHHLEDLQYSRDYYHSEDLLNVACQEKYSSQLSHAPQILKTYREADLILKGIESGYLPGLHPVKFEELLSSELIDSWRSVDRNITSAELRRIWFDSVSEMSVQEEIGSDKEIIIYRITGTVMKVRMRKISVESGESLDLGSDLDSPITEFCNQNLEALMNNFPHVRRLEQLIRMGFYVSLLRDITHSARHKIYQSNIYQINESRNWVELLKSACQLGLDHPIEPNPVIDGALLPNLLSYQKVINYSATIGGITIQSPIFSPYPIKIIYEPISSKKIRPDWKESIQSLRDSLHLPQLQTIQVTTSASIYTGAEINKFWMGLDIPKEKWIDSSLCMGWDKYSVEASLDKIIEIVHTKPLNEQNVIELDVEGFDRFKVNYMDPQLINSVILHQEKGLIYNKTISLYITSDAEMNLETRYGFSEPVAKVIAVLTVAKTITKKVVTSTVRTIAFQH